MVKFLTCRTGVTMWEQLTPADIERAKTRAAALRSETLAKHAEELRKLEVEEAEIDTLERLLASFSEKYMRAPNSASGPATDATVEFIADNAAGAGASSGGEQDVVPPPLRVEQQVSPNFALPVRRLLRG